MQNSYVSNVNKNSVNNIIMDVKKIHYQKKGNTKNVRY